MGMGEKAFLAAQTNISSTTPKPANASAIFCLPVVRVGWGFAIERLSIISKVVEVVEIFEGLEIAAEGSGL